MLVLNENNVVKIPRRGYKLVKSLFGQYEEIPEEWDFSELGKHCTFFVPMRNKPKKFDGHIPWLRIEDLDGKFVSETKSGQYVTSNTVKEMKLRIYPIGTILCSCSATIGVCAITKRELITNQTFIGIFPNCRINNEYLYYYLSTQKNNLIKIGSGSTILYISRKKFEAFPINLPLIQEQQKIASILSGVDALIESTQHIIEKTERLKKGLMQKLLTRGIGHTKFKKAKWLFGKEIEIPQEWNVTRLIEQCIQKPEYGAGESAIEKDLKLPRYIRITDLNDDGSLRNKEWKSIKENAAKDYLLNNNDILFARTGATVGKSYLYADEDGRCAFAGYLIRFQPDQTKLNSKFLFHYIHSIYYWKYIKSIQTWGVQPNVNAEQYSNLLILLSPIHEQQKIASILSGVDAYIQKNQQYKKRLEKLKKGLMQKLLTGQIRVKV